MNQTIQRFREQLTEKWKSSSKSQRYGVIGGIAALIILIIILTYMLTSTNMVPLYSNLSQQEIGQLKAELDERGVSYDIADGGTSILVPEEQSDDLLVDFASQGIPNSGNIDYSFFSENASWGMTDEERQIIEVDALQTELATLIENIDGINRAKVLINRSRETIFVGEETQASSASIVLETDFGYNFTESQVRGLYHLVSKAVPNLPTDNIVIMDQNFNYLDINNSTNDYGNTYVQNQEIKEQVEKDLQRRVQRMLGTMVGQDKVVVSVTTDIDFTKENRMEELVEPVDLENMEGLPVSVDRITETYTGEDGAPLVEGETDIPELQGVEEGQGQSEYEMVRETINNEFNRIQREIVESPYEIRDIGIQVAVDNSTVEDGEAVVLSAAEQAAVEEDIHSILSSIVNTSISSSVEVEEPLENISVVFQEFSRQGEFDAPQVAIPTWLYIVGGILLLAIILLLFLLFRNRREDEQVIEEVYEEEEIPDLEDFKIEEKQTESTAKRKQLEQLAKDQPDEFAKLLRSWISED